MKKYILNIIGVLISTTCYAQTLSINAQVVDEKIPEEAARNLETKLQNALVLNGYADNGYTERFVLTAKVDITQKDVTPTTPARISEKMDITLMVGTAIVELSGVDGSIIIDSVLKEAFKGNVLQNEKMSGEFPILRPGANAVSWTGNVSSVTITPNWRSL